MKGRGYQLWHFLEMTLSDLGSSIRCLFSIMSALKFLYLRSVSRYCDAWRNAKTKKWGTREQERSQWPSWAFYRPI